MQYKSFPEPQLSAAEARKQLSVTITTRFDRNTASLLREVARGKGIGVTTLIRMWTLDLLRRVGPRASERGVWVAREGMGGAGVPREPISREGERW